MSTPPTLGPQPWSRTDLLIAGLLTLCAWFVRRTPDGLCHFDEGAYATSALAIAQGRFPEAMHPDQPLLSPPLYFALCGLLMRLLGTTSEQVLLQVSSLAGTLTAPLLFVLGRECFGRAAGAAAGLLLAVSQLHAGFSTMALTDPLFLLCLVLALWLVLRAEAARSLGLAALAGLATGLAWNTKYHGWLALVVATPAVLLGAWWRGVRAIPAAVARLALAAAVAVATFLPWFWFVQGQPGGYAAVVRQQRQFLREWADALDHAVQQAGYLGFLDTWWIGPALACVLAAVLLGRLRGWRCAVALVPLSVVACLHSAAAALLCAALLALPIALRQRTPGGVLVGTLFGLFTVLTPLYHPYPRLLLPWLAATCLLAGAACAWWCDLRMRLGLAGVIALLVGAGGMLAMPGLGGRHAGPVFHPLREVLGAWRETLARHPLPIAVVGEPALVFHLRQDGREAFHVNSPRVLAAGQELLLITGLYAERAPAVAGWLTSNRPNLESLATCDWRAPDLRRIDDYRPLQLLWPGDAAAEHCRFTLWRAQIPK